jgi:hypothetical protein
MLLRGEIMRFILAIVFVLLSTSALGQDVHLPMVPVLVQPEDVPVPPELKSVPVGEIKADEWYIVTSSIPLIVLHSPDEFVGIATESGPMKFRGKFADGLGKTETRTYTEAYIYVVEAKKSGKIELILIPSGVTDAKTIIRHTLTVSGIGPIPPPVPVPPTPTPPGPTPDPTPPSPPTGVRVILLNNEFDTTADQLNALNSTEIISWLDANTVTWRKWDRTSISKPEMLDKEDPILQTLWKNISANLPAGNIIIVATDTKVYTSPITNIADALAFLNKIKAGK